VSEDARANIPADAAASGSHQSAEATGVIFDIQRFSVHDGPGIRTLVFFKGCPLACLWCSNPESQRFDPELLVDPSKCVACGGCTDVCPHGAVRLEANRLSYDRVRCVACGGCVDVCHAQARTMAGRRVTATEVLVEVLKDAPFFENSGGGLTLGGGEPLAQADFAREILTACRAKGIHTAVETCGHMPWATLETAVPWTDLFLFDLKHLDVIKHGTHTGGDVELILSNLQRLVAAGARAIVRVPVVPGFNDNSDDVRAIAAHVDSLGIAELHLLPYHRLGQNKYRFLSRQYEFTGGEPISATQLEILANVARTAGVVVKIGG
jgi:pyruvate formate lyase activating enzyme